MTGILAPAPARANDGVGLPVLAYYYIWYHATSWDRAKSDLPLLGRYSSDERSVMLAHARTAHAAGLDGFLVSWKHTPELDRRLAMLAEVARESGLRLGIVYQGLDFYRRPLPAPRVADDLVWLAAEYGDDPTFSLCGGPLVIWSGTRQFTPDQVRRVSGRVGDSLVLLASQRSAEEYAPLARYVDGDAYYWSSLDPSRDRHAQDRLDDLGDQVHRHGGLWIPSVAPGFDATLLGEHRVVPRRGGATLRSEWRMALDSSGDGAAITSWNEFSENSHIEQPGVREPEPASLGRDPVRPCAGLDRRRLERTGTGRTGRHALAGALPAGRGGRTGARLSRRHRATTQAIGGILAIPQAAQAHVERRGRSRRRGPTDMGRGAEEL